MAGGHAPSVDCAVLSRMSPHQSRGAVGCFLAVVALLTTGTVSCAPPADADRTGAGSRHAFDRHFETLATFELQEPSGPQLADIEAFSEATNGDLLVAERWSSRVMRYDSTGALLAEFGVRGEGPFEFRGVDGILEGTHNDVIVIDRQLSRITILDAALRPDTLFTFFPTPNGAISPLGRGYVLSTHPGRRATDFTWVSEDWRPVWSVSSRAPTSALMARPYWGSYGTQEFATSSELLIIGFSLYYPLYVYRPPGVLVDTIGQPRTFRVAPIVAAGAFSGPAGPDRREEWFRSFDVIAKLAIVEDTLLIVVHGTLHYSTSLRRTWSEHRRIDVYNLETRRKLLEDVALPEGSRVLGGGARGLYVLVAEPPDAWTVKRLTLTEAG